MASQNHLTILFPSKDGYIPLQFLMHCFQILDIYYSQMVMISYAAILTRIPILFDIDVKKIWVPSNYHIE